MQSSYIKPPHLLLNSQLTAMKTVFLISTILTASIFSNSHTQQCGSQAGGALCSNGLCCSKFGYCGSTDPFCGTGCQSQCDGSRGGGGGGGGGGSGVASIVSSSQFNQMLLHRNDAACPAKVFYTYDAFIAAANSFPGFGTTGDTDTRKREIAAFFAQTSHETTGGYASAADGPYSWGYCFKQEQGNPPD